MENLILSNIFYNQKVFIVFQSRF